MAEQGDIEVVIPAGGAALPGVLLWPKGPLEAVGPFGLVIFAHGSGSSRLSPRNRMVAEVLRRAGLATLLFDLLTEAEAVDRKLVFDIPLLAERLGMARAWAGQSPRTRELRVAYFGASTGAGAALVAAEEDHSITAVVSRGGRPDLAGDALARVRAPTLLIVGGRDTRVIGMNEWALEHLRCEKRLEIVDGATHLFEEAGTLEAVAELASGWLVDHLANHGGGGACGEAR